MKSAVASPPETPAIEMIDVAVASINAPDKALITGVNWKVMPGDCWVIGGLPGSGKTDLLVTAAGLLRPRRGVHRLFGQDLAAFAEDEAVRLRLRVGLVFANEGRLFNHLTVSENLALPICYHRNCTGAEAQDRVRSVLDAVGLNSVAHHTPGSITRSMRQRVALARALTLNPEVLLLDDPLRALDPIQTKWWLEFLSRLCSGDPVMDRCKVTLVITAEHLRPWTQQAKQFALISNGAWLILGGSEQLTEHNDPLLRELMAASF